ncbi:hypothetical protein ACR6HW_03900 [Fusibacter sp. JL298sf-3]
MKAIFQILGFVCLALATSVFFTFAWSFGGAPLCFGIFTAILITLYTGVSEKLDKLIEAVKASNQ